MSLCGRDFFLRLCGRDILSLNNSLWETLCPLYDEKPHKMGEMVKFRLTPLSSVRCSGLDLPGANGAHAAASWVLPPSPQFIYGLVWVGSWCQCLLMGLPVVHFVRSNSVVVAFEEFDPWVGGWRRKTGFYLEEAVVWCFFFFCTINSCLF